MIFCEVRVVELWFVVCVDFRGVKIVIMVDFKILRVWNYLVKFLNYLIVGFYGLVRVGLEYNWIIFNLICMFNVIVF